MDKGKKPLAGPLEFPGPRPDEIDTEHLRDPASYWVNATLRDGTPVHIRAIRADDHDEEAAFVQRMSPESRYFRFFEVKRDLTEAEIEYFTEIDFVNHVALVVTRAQPSAPAFVGIGRYIIGRDSPPDSAEIAFAVDDGLHGQGVGTLLLHHLSAIARANGLKEFRATVLSQNRAMLEVFAHSGLPRESTTASEVTDVVLSLAGG